MLISQQGVQSKQSGSTRASHEAVDLLYKNYQNVMALNLSAEDNNVIEATTDLVNIESPIGHRRKVPLK